MTRTGTHFAAALDDADLVPFANLPLWDAAPDAAADTEVIAAAIAELLERMATGALDFEARHDIACDLLEASERLRIFALAVLS